MRSLDCHFIVAVACFMTLPAYAGLGFEDCNRNGIPDDRDIGGGGSPDCNENLVPDECEIDENSAAPGGPFYCTAGCDADCNETGVPDKCELEDNDCNHDGVPDTCEPDGDGDTVIDACDNCPVVHNADQSDADADGVGDACEIILAAMDVMPGVCPNAVDPTRVGKIVPVLIVGGPSFDVRRVDLTSLRLARADGAGEEVAPFQRWQMYAPSFSDVTAPFKACRCRPLTPDSVPDMRVYFSAWDLSGSLKFSTAVPGDTVGLVLRGYLEDGSAFQAIDCVTVAGPDPRRKRRQGASR